MPLKCHVIGIVLVLLLLPRTAAAAQEALTCSACGARISGQYYRGTQDGKAIILCKPCYEKQKTAQARRCALCGQAIRGSHSTVKQDGKSYEVCPSCAQKIRDRTPTCSACGKKISGQYYMREQDGQKQPICKECLDASRQESLPVCAICGQRITGEHIKHADGKHYCPTCMKLPRCPHCQRPLAPDTGVRKGGQTFCATCAKDIRVCSCCGQALLGKYFSHPFTEGVFCPTCEQDRPHCVSCERPIAEDPILVGGKRPMCKECFRTAVLTKDRVDAIFKECQAIIRKQIGESTYHDLPLEIVDEIGEIQKGTDLPITGKERGLFKRTNETFRIYIQYGLSEPLTYETLPHEWGHAWFAENGNRQHPQWVEEGFCQWIAAQILTVKEFTRGLNILKTREDLYGQGYRHIQAIADRGGTQAVLEYVRMPPGPGQPKRDPTAP